MVVDVGTKFNGEVQEADPLTIASHFSRVVGWLNGYRQCWYVSKDGARVGLTVLFQGKLSVNVGDHTVGVLVETTDKLSLLASVCQLGGVAGRLDVFG